MKRMLFNNKITISQTRNGFVNTIGIEVDTASNRINNKNLVYSCIRLLPITSRKMTGNCWIEIPIDIIPQLIKDLQYFYDNSSKT